MSPTDLVLVTPPSATDGGRTLWLDASLPHLGVAYVAGAVRDAGIAVRVIDAAGAHWTPPQVMARLLALRPKMLGLTAATCQLGPVSQLARMVRTQLPECTIVLGGWHATAVPVETLQHLPELHFVIAGEGEQALVCLWRALGEPAALDGVPGLCWRDAEGVIHSNPRAWVEGALDILPSPDFSGFSLGHGPGLYGSLVGRRGIALPATTSRGCPCHCEFCFSATGDRPRLREVDAVVDELQRGVRDHDARIFYIIDETFSLSRKRAAQLCEAFIRSGLSRQISWVAQTRPDFVTADLLALMRRAGCRVLSFGVDTGNQAMQDAVGRRLDLQVARRNIDEAGRQDIVADLNFILGHPHETRATAQETIDYALSVRAPLASFALLSPFPGTKVAQRAAQGDGLRLLSADWSAFDKQWGGACETIQLDLRALRRLQRQAYLRFYGRPRQLRAVSKVAATLGTRNVATFAYRSLLA